MNELRRAALPGALLTALLGVEAAFRPIPFGFAFRAWLIGLGALAAAALVRGSLAPYRQVRVEPVHLARRRPAAVERPAGLEEVERAVDFAIWNPADLNRRLRPLLREVAAHRLRMRRGVDIDSNPESARRILGEAAWEFVALPVGGDSVGRTGASLAAVRAAIERLEEL